MSAVKEYSNGEVTILWEAEKCIHSANCVNGLPEVFDTNNRPWINPKGASSDKIVETVSKCPSGALKIKQETDIKKEEATIEINLLANGPLYVKGNVKITDSDGNIIKTTNNAALCRCGASEKKPFCDGAHKKIEFIA